MSDINLRILELLISKVCHDLISPIGAVNNGVEFVQEMGAEDAGDAIDLIAFSAGQASSKLRAYRMAYGAGGADNSIKPEDVYNVIEDMIKADGKISQDWDKDAPFGLDPETFERPEGFAKTLISALLMAMDCLPKGGVLSVTSLDDDPMRLNIAARGEDACIRDRSLEALKHEMRQDDLEPKYIHPYITGLVVGHYGFSVDMQEGDDCVDITLGFSS